jgi:hypothetical protein
MGTGKTDPVAPQDIAAEAVQALTDPEAAEIYASSQRIVARDLRSRSSATYVTGEIVNSREFV